MVGISVRASVQLQHRLFLTSWVKKSRVVTCLNIRDYGSSGPVRYKPKRSLNDQKSGTPPSSGILYENNANSCLDTEARTIKVEHSGAGRNHFSTEKSGNQNQNETENYSITEIMQGPEDELDDKLGFVIDAFLQEPEDVVDEFNIYEKNYNKKSIYEKKCYHGEKNSHHGDKKEQEYKRAEKLATELLAKRAYPAVRLKKDVLMIDRTLSVDTVWDVINDFKRRGFLNDTLYAEAYARSKWSSYCWGPRKIKAALLNQGVEGDEVADRAIKLVFEDGEETSSLGLSEHAWDHLFVNASKQWLRARDRPKTTRTARMVSWLRYRGFGWDVISTLLKKLETEHPSSH